MCVLAENLLKKYSNQKNWGKNCVKNYYLNEISYILSWWSINKEIAMHWMRNCVCGWCRPQYELHVDAVIWRYTTKLYMLLHNYDDVDEKNPTRTENKPHMKLKILFNFKFENKIHRQNSIGFEKRLCFQNKYLILFLICASAFMLRISFWLPLVCAISMPGCQYKH